MNAPNKYIFVLQQSRDQNPTLYQMVSQTGSHSKNAKKYPKKSNDYFILKDKNLKNITQFEHVYNKHKSTVVDA